MSKKINYSIGVDVTLGPKLSAALTADVEAYDKINLVVDKNAAPLVQLQPNGAGKVTLILLTASKYDPLLTYQPDGMANPIPLQAPLFLVGVGNVSLIGLAQKLTVKNGTADPVTVEILVGRAAV
jgi:hypothetical protein